VLEHEVLIVLNGKFILLLYETIVLAQLELELIDEDLDLLLGYLHAFLALVTLLKQLLKELLGLELDDGSDLEECLACLDGSVVGGESNYTFERDAVGEEVEVDLVAKAGDMNDGSVVEVRIDLEVIIHLIQIT
jgi:hypothetical protein